jgi:hypothetical protein
VRPPHEHGLSEQEDEDQEIQMMAVEGPMGDEDDEENINEDDFDNDGEEGNKMHFDL